MNMKKIKVSFNKVIPKNTVEFRFVKGRVTRTVLEDKREVLEVGIGDFKEIDRHKLSKIIRKTIRTAKAQKISKLAHDPIQYSFPKLKKMSHEEFVNIFGQEIEIANYDYNQYKSKPKDGFDFVTELIFVGNIGASIKKSFAKGQMIGEYVNHCRDIANTPGGDMTPKKMVTEAKKLAKGSKVKVTALGEKQLKTLKAGAILGVGQGSKEESQLIVMEYAGLPRAKSSGKSANLKDPIVLVGKGITFDTGGLNIKTGDNMLDMHMDMSGGAAVIAAVALAAKLGIKKNIVGIVPAVENMPSGESYRPGDVLTGMSGKKIDVLNTDAEGRLVLSDALTYANKKYSPKLMVDVATLTGAAVVAVGLRTNVIMTPDQKLQNLFMQLGEESGDRMWPLPCWDDYNENIEGRFGDISNLGKPGGGGGTIAAGMFLKAFAEDTPWVHIDMAPRMTSIPSDNLAKGAAGEPVRFFTKLLESY